jgi:small subunit ribosomal protein S6
MPNLQKYELTFILSEKEDLEKAQKKTTQIKETISKFGGTVEKEEIWGRRELAYKIKDNRSGIYVTIWFDLLRESVKPLEQLLQFDEKIIRSLITKAYTSAQPGTLYPVTEENKSKETSSAPDENASPEEMLRRSSKASSKSQAKITTENEVDSIPEEERLKKLDESLEELLKEEE